MAENQVDNLVQKAEELEKALDSARSGPNARALGGGTPTAVAFPTAYKLTEEQEKELVRHAWERLRKLEVEMGRSIVRNTAYNTNPTSLMAFETFLGRRQIFEWIYENNVSWRPAVMGGIFEQSNLIVPVTRRIVRQMIAKAQKYFLGTDPWFSALPEGAADRDIADKVERYARYKFNRLGVKDAMAMALQLAFVRGECVIKTTHVKKEQVYQRNAKVLVDLNGQPILATDGDFITDKDSFVPAQSEIGEPIMLLRRDMATIQPPVPVFIEQTISRKAIISEGPTAEPVYYQDFICPLNATSVDDADFVAHLYDAPIMELADLYNKKGNKSEETPEEEMLRIQAAIDQIRLSSSESGIPKTGAKQARTERGEAYEPNNTFNNPTMEIAECYLRYDANGDGITEEIMLLLDVRNQRAIFYEYVANVTSDGRRPFTVVRVNPVDGRWYGMGGVEQFKTSQDFMDLTINRLNFSQSSSGRVTFWRPDATFEGSANPNLILNSGGTYTLRPGFAATDALTYVALPESKEKDLNFMLQYFTQLVQLESGVMTGGDQEFSGLPSSKLATGIRSIDQAGNEMFSQYLMSLEPALSQVVNRLVLILLDNMNKKEMFNYLEGDALQLVTITPEEIADININIRLLLTRYHGEQQLQSNAQAAGLVTQFYGLPPEVQQKVALFYNQSLKALGIVDAESIIQPFAPPPTQNGITPDGRVFGQAGSPGSPPPSVGGTKSVPVDAGLAGGNPTPA
jgi:hypothetical protein